MDDEVKKKNKENTRNLIGPSADLELGNSSDFFIARETLLSQYSFNI